MPNREIVIDPTFEGPPGTAQGGYACGLLSAYLPPDAEVTLRKPVRLGAALRLEPRDGGLTLYDGPTVVAEAATTRLVGGAPQPPTFAEALAASTGFPGFTAHPYPRCVACGPERTDAGAFRIFPGPLGARELLAGVWYPDGAAVVDATIRPEFAWAALDCPGGWAAAWFGPVRGPAVLGRMAARVDGPIAAADAFILCGWMEGASGRKLHAGSALYSRSGELHGFSRQTWISLAGAGQPR